MKSIKVFLAVYREYLLNCTLAGCNYIADSKYHFSERIFWLICLVLSCTGSYYLIKQTMVTFDKNSISMVVESLPPQEETNFPSLAVCEMGYSKQIYEVLENIIQGMKLDEDTEYNYDVEDFMLRVIFHNLYNFGSITSYCAPYRDCTDCIKCPTGGYSNFAKLVRANCTELFNRCIWNGKPFNCCEYFQPLQTTLGQCFVLNSIQVTKKNSPQWLDMRVGWQSGSGLLQMEYNKAVSVHIFNEEDIPHILLTTLQFNEQPEGFHGTVQIKLQNTVNDEEIINLKPEIRRCIFPQEQSDSEYEYYSYSTCVTECLKLAQIKVCNCTHYNMIYNAMDRSPICDYDGLVCLDRNDLMFPQTTIMQPWRTNGLVCRCLPSCTEHEIKVVGRTSRVDSGKKTRSLEVSLQAFPTQRYRRQTVREHLDIVVSVGGILGLFSGASILSGVEFIYFFTVRLIGTTYLRRRTGQMPAAS